mgnify:CR=1 FL=1
MSLIPAPLNERVVGEHSFICLNKLDSFSVAALQLPRPEPVAEVEALVEALTALLAQLLADMELEQDAMPGPEAVMGEDIGDDILRVPQIARERNAALHLYGKTEARPGRKMGHVNRITG